MLTCERCQTKNLEGSQYCDECGGALAGGGASLHSRGATSSDGHDDAAALRIKLVERRGGASSDPSGNGAASERNSDSQSVRQHEPLSSSAARAASASSASSQFVVRSNSEIQANGVHAKLVIHRGRSAGKEFLLDEDESHIGRWDADGGIFPDVDLDADDPEAKVSRRHARITRRGGQYFVEDMGSTNGTFINRGRRLLPGDRQALRDGDEVIVGKTFLRFQILK